MKRSRKLPSTYYNSLTMTGAYVSSVSLLLILLFLGVNFLFNIAPNHYLGIVLFLVLPMILVFGLILIPVGVIRTNRRIKSGKDSGQPPSLKIDFGTTCHKVMKPEHEPIKTPHMRKFLALHVTSAMALTGGPSLKFPEHTMCMRC